MGEAYGVAGECKLGKLMETESDEGFEQSMRCDLPYKTITLASVRLLEPKGESNGTSYEAITFICPSKKL